MNIHETIKEIREEKKFSQGAVAHNLGLSQSQYSRRERGEIKFLADEILLLTKVLETPVSKLYGEKKTVFNNHDQKGGSFGQYVSVPEKVIELYEARSREKDEIIARYETRLEEKDETIAFLRKQAR